MTLAHRTVLLEKAVEGLALKENGTYVDCTYGRGGHSRLILSKLGPDGRLFAFDRDPEAVATAKEIQDPRIQVVHTCFSGLQTTLAQYAIGQVDGILMDLGVSSPQLDNWYRGFSFRFDAPLDMRMDTTCGLTAQAWLNQATEKEIAEVIKKYGEERFAQQIATAIITSREKKPLITTGQLAQIVAGAVPTYEAHQNPATRTFQAIRIFINHELEELSLTLPQSIHVLAPHGRLVVIAFHSLEDRIVKHFMRKAATSDFFPSKLPVRQAEIREPLMHLVGKPVRASQEEIIANSRARSAILRIAERTQVLPS